MQLVPLQLRRCNCVPLVSSSDFAHHQALEREHEQSRLLVLTLVSLCSAVRKRVLWVFVYGSRMQYVATSVHQPQLQPQPARPELLYDILYESGILAWWL